VPAGKGPEGVSVETLECKTGPGQGSPQPGLPPRRLAARFSTLLVAPKAPCCQSRVSSRCIDFQTHLSQVFVSHQLRVELSPMRLAASLETRPVTLSVIPRVSVSHRLLAAFVPS
jgi:hypothetical protein